MSELDLIRDRTEREAAETTFDRNIVVVAGAGTGKTTLLVNRLVHMLIKEPDPVPITRVVALTFTNKAATEMKVRLRGRLAALARGDGDAGERGDGGAVTVAGLCSRYGVSRQAVADRARAALADLEKAQIGTLHSFAAHLLRLHPLECGLDPAFQEDDGTRFDEHFTQAWDLWIDNELGRAGTRHDLWRLILGSVSLEDVKTFARALSSELVELEPLETQMDAGRQMGGAIVDRRLSERLLELSRKGKQLLAAHPVAKPRKVERMLAAAVTLLAEMAERGACAAETCSPDDRACLEMELGSAVSGWEEPGFKEATRIIKIAQNSLDVDEVFFNRLLRLIGPWVSSVRVSFVAAGWVTFDGLLARARSLMRDHPLVRERIKREYRAILVDEFQDTDPVQYEILLAASERAGVQADAWQDMELEPGKLCIVGDPKQSIYAFRRADIEAFDRVVRKVEAQGGATFTLTTNFRSDAALLGPVNATFDRLFERTLHVQPANVRLEVRPNRRPGPVDPGVLFRIVRPPEDQDAFDAADASRAEAEALAQWLAEDLLRRPAVKPGQVALLFRKLTQADVYTDALRRHDVPYLIDGEKHFYRRQEVIDLVNLLRILDNPHDHLALIGVLRSALGALSDRDVYDVRRADLFDYRAHARVCSWAHPRARDLGRLYERLALLHEQAATRPLAEVTQLVFDSLPVLELAAASLHGEQAVVNLLKVKQLAASLADRATMTLSRFVDLMAARLEEQPDEAESPLAEESLDAVHVLTVHKAKGLEFPVVVLPGLHQGMGRTAKVPMVLYDWSSGLYGLALGDRRSLGGLLIRDTLVEREAAERRRVLYVGMTRAKDLLVMSGAVTARSSGDNVIGLFGRIGVGEIGTATAETLSIGGSHVRQIVLAAPQRLRRRRASGESRETDPIDPSGVAALWKVRTDAWESARGRRWHLTPTGLVAEGTSSPPGARVVALDRSVSRLVGVCAHRVLQHWNFVEDPRGLLLETRAAVEGLADEERRDHGPAIIAALSVLFESFGRSAVYARLRRADILGREIPFMIPWGEGQMMEGVIDLFYRLEGRLWVADYKTDLVGDVDLASYAGRHRTQGEIYRRAVRQAMGSESVGLELIFLRNGASVQW